MSSHAGMRKAIDVQTESSWIIRQHLAESLQDFFKLNLLTKKPPKTIPPTGKRKARIVINKSKSCTVNSLYNGYCMFLELVSSLAGVYFSQKSAINFCLGF